MQFHSVNMENDNDCNKDSDSADDGSDSEDKLDDEEEEVVGLQRTCDRHQSLCHIGFGVVWQCFCVFCPKRTHSLGRLDWLAISTVALLSRTKRRKESCRTRLHSFLIHVWKGVQKGQFYVKFISRVWSFVFLICLRSKEQRVVGEFIDLVAVDSYP